MARTARTEEVKIEDMFFDLEPDRQASLLPMLERLHQLKSRQTKAAAKVKPEANGKAETAAKLPIEDKSSQ